ncbi:hypothetical protein C8R47DRAFT_108606 [Mycena vitilis]|nr:hypothetical protein C8R47DRAFT_108606 [Mycena vitilis]
MLLCTLSQWKPRDNGAAYSAVSRTTEFYLLLSREAAQLRAPSTSRPRSRVAVALFCLIYMRDLHAGDSQASVPTPWSVSEPYIKGPRSYGPYVADTYRTAIRPAAVFVETLRQIRTRGVETIENIRNGSKGFPACIGTRDWPRMRRIESDRFFAPAAVLDGIERAREGDAERGTTLPVRALWRGYRTAIWPARSLCRGRAADQGAARVKTIRRAIVILVEVRIRRGRRACHGRNGRGRPLTSLQTIRCASRISSARSACRPVSLPGWAMDPCLGCKGDPSSRRPY